MSTHYIINTVHHPDFYFPSYTAAREQQGQQHYPMLYSGLVNGNGNLVLYIAIVV